MAPNSESLYTNYETNINHLQTRGHTLDPSEGSKSPVKALRSLLVGALQ